MKSAVEQLSTYKSVHLNKKNVGTHFIGVPAIIWSLMVFLSLVELPVTLGDSGYSLTLAMVFFMGVLIYYFMLHISLAIGQVIFIIPIFYTAHLVAKMPDAPWIATVVFIVAWIIQFIGHHYEKAKPAFVDDLNQLLIGPFFLMAEVFFMLGVQKKLEQEITPLAVEKRRAFEAKRK
jgi:uncharacterized membrane protein YGL010W